MTTNEAIELASYQLSVMEAFDAGQSIESKHNSSGSTWGSVTKPEWDWFNFNYRIQPQPTFSVGDWVVFDRDTTYQVFKVASINTRYLCSTGHQYLPEHCTPWQPQSRDWVWMWGDSHVSGKFTHPRLFQFSHMDEDGMYVATLDFTMPYCEPFIGSIPCILRDM